MTLAPEKLRAAVAPRPSAGGSDQQSLPPRLQRNAEHRLPASLWEDLIGVGWKEHGRGLSDKSPTESDALDCYGCVLEVYRRLGIALPDASYDPATYADALAAQLGAWEEIPYPEPGCVVLATLDGGPHVGVYLGRDRWLHATRAAGVVATPLSAMQHARKVRGFFRWRGASTPLSLEVPPAAHPTDLTIVEVDATSGDRAVRRLPWPQERAGIEGPYLRIVHGEVAPGGVLVALRGAGELVTATGALTWLGQTLIGLAVAAVGTTLSILLSPSLPKPKDRDEQSSPAFDLAGFLRNGAGIGAAQPVVYGEHRVGGHIISAFQRADEQGRSHLFMLIMVSRGPVQSVGGVTVDIDGLRGTAIPSSIQIDGNPASSYDCEVSVRLGGTDQEPIPGFREQVTVTPYAYTLSTATPLFTHVGTEEIEAFELTLNFPVGLYHISPNGNVGTRTVYFTVRWRAAGTSTWTTDNTWYVNAGRRGAFSRTYRRDGLTKGIYEIQIERTTPAWPEASLNNESRSDLVSVNEIGYDALSYPGKALLGIRIVATEQLSGGIPTITSVVEGRKVYVWDGLSTTSPAFGSGEVYTDNPAWCVMDLLLHPHYGLGRNAGLTLNDIDLTSFLAWANHCDTLVDDGRGGSVKRAVIGHVADSVSAGWELANQIAQSAWARLTFAGRKIRAVVEADDDPVYAFAMGNVRDFEMTFLGRTQRPNTVEVGYFNSETNYEADQATKDVLATGEAPIKESLQAVGVTRAAQAYRLAQFRLNHATLSIRRVAFTAGPESLHLLVGDMIWVSHDAVSVGNSGRVLSAASGDVSLDHSLTIASGTNKILVRTKGTGADVLQERTLTNGTYARATPIAVTPNWDGGDVPVNGDPWAAGPSTTYRRKFRISSIDVTPDMARRIVAYECPSEIYDDDPGDVEEFTDVMPDPRSMPGSVSDVQVEDVHQRSEDGTVLDAIRITFTPSERWHKADVYIRPRDGEAEGWQHVGRTERDQITITDGISAGAALDVSVVAVSPLGVTMLPQHGARTIHVVHPRHEYASDPPECVEVHQVNEEVVLVLPKHTDPDFAGYDVRIGPAWAGSIRVAIAQPGEHHFKIRADGDHQWRVRALNRSGRVSVAETAVTVAGYIPVTRQNEDELDEHPGWAGTLTDVAVTGSLLELDGDNLTGTYESVPLTLGAVTRVLPLVEVRVELEQRELLGHEMVFSPNDPMWVDVPGDELFSNGFEFVGAERLRGEQMTFPADSVPGRVLPGTGRHDIIADLEPTVEIRTSTDGGSVWSDWMCYVPQEVELDAIQVRLTLNRPDVGFNPQASHLRVVLLSLIPPAGGDSVDAPDDAEYIVAATHADLTAERLATNTTSITWNFGTAGQAKAERAALTGDVTASADSNATTIAANTVSDTKLRDSAALSVIGRSANSTGDPADIAAGSDGEVLRRSGTTLGFGTVATAGIADDAVTYAKIQNVSATDRILGRDTAGAGNIEELTVSGGLEFTGTGIQRSALTGDVTATAGSNSTTIANNAVKDTQIRDSAALSVIGRSANSTGDPADIAAGTDYHILQRVGTTLGFVEMPIPFCCEYVLNGNIGANSDWYVWENSSNGWVVNDIVPTGKTLKILSCTGRATAAASVGTYTFEGLIRNITDGSSTSLDSDSKTAGQTLLLEATGTLASPLVSLAAGKNFALEVKTGAGNPGDVGDVRLAVRGYYV